MFKFVFGALLAALSFSAQAQFQGAICKSDDMRVCKIMATIERIAPEVRIVVRDDAKLGLREAQYEWGLNGYDVLWVGNTGPYTLEELTYVIAHEVGHSLHRHGRRYTESFASAKDKTLSDRDLVIKYGHQARNGREFRQEINHQHEFEADDFAVKVMYAAGVNVVMAMRGALVTPGASDTHPNRRVRTQRAEQLLARLKSEPQGSGLLAVNVSQ